MNLNVFKKSENMESTNNSDGNVHFTYEDKKKSFIDLESLKAYSGLIISLTIIIFTVLWVMIPQYNKFFETNDLIKAKTEEANKVKTQADYLENLYKYKDELEANLKTSKLALADEEDAIPYILDQIVQISEESGVSLEGFSLGGTATSSNFEGLYEVRTVIKITGGYDRIMDFLNRIQKAQRLVDVESVSVEIDYEVTDDEIGLLGKVNNDDEDEGEGISSDVETDLNNELSEVLESENDLNQSSDVIDPRKEAIYSLNVTLNGYYMPDVDVSMVGVDRLVNQPKFDNVMERIKKLDYYNPNEDAIAQEVGKENPFKVGNFDEESGEFIEEDDDSEEREAPRGSIYQ